MPSNARLECQDPDIHCVLLMHLLLNCSSPDKDYKIRGIGNDDTKQFKGQLHQTAATRDSAEDCLSSKSLTSEILMTNSSVQCSEPFLSYSVSQVTMLQ